MYISRLLLLIFFYLTLTLNIVFDAFSYIRQQRLKLLQLSAICLIELLWLLKNVYEFFFTYLTSIFQLSDRYEIHVTLKNNGWRILLGKERIQKSDSFKKV